MRQIILIGFSTTGKSTLINKIVNQFPQREKHDTDIEIAKDFGGSIANIYYSNPVLEHTYKQIQSLEEKILQALKLRNDNLIIAAGPAIPFKESFSDYVINKNPHVVLLEKPASEIYKSLLDRRNDMKKNPKHQRPDFGIWDINVMVNEDLVEYSKEQAIQKIQLLLEERRDGYNKYATLKLNSIDIFNENLPSNLLQII